MSLFKILWFFGLLLSYQLLKIDGKRISFFEPDTVNASNDFAAAWITTKKRLIQSKYLLQHASNMAGASFAILRNRCSTCKTFMTYDYFDFMVEHLSSMTNQLTVYSKDLLQIKLTQLRKLRNDSQRGSLQQLLSNPLSSPRKLLNDAIAVIPYSSRPFSTTQEIDLQIQFRKLFIELATRSIHHYFPSHLVIFTASFSDSQDLKHMNLPSSICIIQLDSVPINHKNQTVLLPSKSLLFLIDLIERNLIYQENNCFLDMQDIRYILFSEGDQILHIRSLFSLYHQLQHQLEDNIIVPHRMQTLPSAKEFPEATQKNLLQSSYQLPLAKLIVQPYQFEVHGSCCDGGRMDIQLPCRDATNTKRYVWWYQCKEYGLPNITYWMKFTENGFTFPLITEHRRFCEYSSVRLKCPAFFNLETRSLVPNPAVLQLPNVNDESFQFIGNESSVIKLRWERFNRFRRPSHKQKNP